MDFTGSVFNHRSKGANPIAEAAIIGEGINGSWLTVQN
jgi:hypothetical protein